MSALRDKLKAAGINVGRTKLEAAWCVAHKAHADDHKRVAAFWHAIMREKDLQAVAAAMLDELLLRDMGHRHLIAQFEPAHSQQQPIAGNPHNGTDLSHRAHLKRVVGAVPSQTSRLAALKVATTIFDTYKLEDGTPLGDVKMAQIPAIKARYTRHAALLDMVYKHAKPSDVMASVRECISHAQIVRMIQKAAEVQDEAA